MINRLELKNFTAFDELLVDFSPGVNLIIGENGTGKTHILKIMYSVLSALKDDRRVSEKIVKVFLPKENRLGRLVKRAKGSSRCDIRIIGENSRFYLTFSNHTKGDVLPTLKWAVDDIGQSVFIPVKEVLSNAPGFLALYNERAIHFEEIYADIINKASLPPFTEHTYIRTTKKFRQFLGLNRVLEGKVILKNNRFYLKNSQGELEFDLLAEGTRKLGLLWLLIQNGVLFDGSTLFWDEPETNLNPIVFDVLVQTLLFLQRVLKVQIFIATHSYALLKEFDIQKKEGHAVKFFSLMKDKQSRKISIVQGNDYQSIVPNPISDEYVRLYDAEVRRSLEGRK
jgi:AAA15 family ATPase/GTPase